MNRRRPSYSIGFDPSALAYAIGIAVVAAALFYGIARIALHFSNQ